MVTTLEKLSDAEGKVIRTARTLKGKVMGETGKDGADLPGRTELKDREGGGGGEKSKREWK